MARSSLTNNMHDVVKVIVRSHAIENMLLNRGQSDVVTGPEGETFTYAWKTRDDIITADEIDAYGAEGSYGTNITFGSPPGRVP